MSGAWGDALEWALALARAPGERETLRQRPLPDGIEALLQIAAGSHGAALQAAMARTGESEAELVEAVRFYLREVLFHAGADAYRMLGLAQGASSEQIKGHHRLLLQWLHPDRQTSDWDAIFAGRINAAWNALRTPERRAAYDASHPAAPQRARAAPTRPAPRVIASEPLAADAVAARWRRRTPVLVLFAACGVLGIAALRDALREPGAGDRIAAEPAARAADADENAVALQLPQSTPGRTAGTLAAPPRRRAAAPASANPVASLPPPVQSPTRMAGPPQVPLRRGALPPAPPSISTPPPMAPAPMAAARGDPALAAAPRPSSRAVAPSTDKAADMTTHPLQKMVRAPTRVPTVPVPAPPPARPREPAAALPASATAQRVEQAQATGRQLLAFLSGRSKANPPIWDSLAAQQRAQRLRDSLQASGATRAGEASWRVDQEDAALRTMFGDTAQVRAQLVWRDQRWLVSGVALEQAP